MTFKRRFFYILRTFIKYSSLIIITFISVLPTVSTVITALKTKEEYASTNVMTPPGNWLNISNFITAWKDANMGLAFRNTLIILVFVLFGSIMFGSMLAYILSRFKFRGNGFIRNLFLFAALIPGIATQVTVYQIMHALNLINTLHGYIILMMGTDVISIYIYFHTVL